MTKDDRAGIAEGIGRTYQPHLSLLHIFERITTAGQDPEAHAAIEQAAARAGKIVSAIADTGMQDRTDVVFVSDHGSLPVRHQLNPNAAFRRAGLLEVNDRGHHLARCECAVGAIVAQVRRIGSAPNRVRTSQ